MVPNVEHKNRVRHLYTNFKIQTKNKGKALKDYLWKAAKATYLKEFEDAMKEIKALSIEAHKCLKKKSNSMV